MRCSAQGLVLVVQQEVQETQVEVREIQQEVQVTQMEVQEVEVEVVVVATRQVPCMQFQAKVTGYLMSNIQIQYTAVLSLTAVHNL